jgi:hypothetical protein
MHVNKRILNYIAVREIAVTKKMLKCWITSNCITSSSTFASLPPRWVHITVDKLDYKNITFVLLNYESYFGVNKLHLDDPRE